MPQPLLIFSSIFCFSFLLTACGNQPVQPWQKQDLARPEMQFQVDSVQPVFEQHFYFSKEGSSGGEGFSGGGCGCN